MRVLRDTHAYLWFITDDSKLSATGKATIADPANAILVSPASDWEIAIKVSLGKDPLSVPFESLITQGVASSERPNRAAAPPSTTAARSSTPCST